MLEKYYHAYNITEEMFTIFCLAYMLCYMQFLITQLKQMDIIWKVNWSSIWFHNGLSVSSYQGSNGCQDILLKNANV